MAIVLSGAATDAWRSGGRHWKAWSYRLVTAGLKVGSGRGDRLRVFSCYAPNICGHQEGEG